MGSQEQITEALIVALRGGESRPLWKHLGFKQEENMKKSLEIDFADLTDILEGFTKKLDKTSQADLIDLAARLKPVAKHCGTIDEYVKGIVKDRLKHNEGFLAGGLFKAVLKLVPTSRLNQKRLKEEKPAVHAAYCDDAVDERVTFEVR